MVNPLPPAGVDAGAFYDLVDARRTGLHDNLLAIDKAANNTSIVFSLEWRGWKLLFPGDAEQESWRMMDEQGVLEPVHLLKIAHHGSWNGTPQGEILDKILPPTRPDDRKRYAVVSTCLDTYPGVPDDTTENTLRARIDELHTTLGRSRTPPTSTSNCPDDRKETTMHPHACIDRSPPPEKLIESAELSVKENPANVPIVVVHPGMGVAPPTRQELAGITGKKWQNGKRLRARFLDGKPSVQQRVEEHAKRWSDFANITVEFGNDQDAEIRISFEQEGSWSYIGTDRARDRQVRADDELRLARGRHRRTRSTSASSCTSSATRSSASTSTRTRSRPIPWDKDAVYALLHGPAEQLDEGRRSTRTSSPATRRTSPSTRPSIPKSIMLYPIPNELTIGDYEVGFNTTLSDTDKSFIATVYPQDAPDVVALEVDGPAVDASIGEHGEEDRFRFTVASGGKHVVETDGPTDVVMALLGPDDPALLVGQDDDSGKGSNAKIEAALEPGDYMVRIRHFLPTGTGTYSISVRRSNG